MVTSCTTLRSSVSRRATCQLSDTGRFQKLSRSDAAPPNAGCRSLCSAVAAVPKSCRSTALAKNEGS
ncbi:MAG: hypothetical protein ACK4N5_17740, partial [Myxococcales bacterium]